MTDADIESRFALVPDRGAGGWLIYDSTSGRCVKTRSDGRGYLCCTIDGKTYKAHTIACIIANGPRPKGHIADHIYGDKLSLNPFHLEWVSKSENVRRAHKAGRMSRPIKRAVKCHRKELPNRWPSTSQAAKYFKCSPGTIASALTGKSKSARGYKWSYV